MAFAAFLAWGEQPSWSQWLAHREPVASRDGKPRECPGILPVRCWGRQTSVARRQNLLPKRGDPVSLLTGDFGTGKSLAAKRALQAAIAALQNRQATAIPVFIQADELEGSLQAAVRQYASELGDPQTEGVFLVVDGLEEAGVGGALSILGETRVLVETWPGSRALVTSRALPVPTPIEEERPLPPLSRRAADDLIARVSGRGSSPALSTGWAQPVQEAIDRPLFAILLGGYLREQTPELPHSLGDLISLLVARSLPAAGLRRPPSSADPPAASGCHYTARWGPNSSQRGWRS